MEETGLKISKVIEELCSWFEYSTSEVVDGAVVSKTCVQVNFVVEVEVEEVRERERVSRSIRRSIRRLFGLLGVNWRIWR